MNNATLNAWVANLVKTVVKLVDQRLHCHLHFRATKKTLIYLFVCVFTKATQLRILHRPFGAFVVAKASRTAQRPEGERVRRDRLHAEANLPTPQSYHSHYGNSQNRTLSPTPDEGLGELRIRLGSSLAWENEAALGAFGPRTRNCVRMDQQPARSRFASAHFPETLIPDFTKFASKPTRELQAVDATTARTNRGFCFRCSCQHFTLAPFSPSGEGEWCSLSPEGEKGWG